MFTAIHMIIYVVSQEVLAVYQSIHDYVCVSQEVLAVYLQQFPDSAIALNLKACNHFRLYNGKAAEVWRITWGSVRVRSDSTWFINLSAISGVKQLTMT